jgi:AraC family transcriptional regulator of adaptative response / DNA-3-methyladenine glycosylase II
MLPDADTCYRALQSRDARFDGRFFTGVKTTGVYCRPICPARTPLRKNIEFYRCASEAEAAGFRPCLRCRPETSPGTPAWAGTSATVSRAMRLIGEGAMDDGSVDDLADRLGVGARHLRRLFDEHLGASPVAIAQTRRLHFAKKLMDETTLPLTEIAFASGFGSLRRFNAVFREAYGMPPSEVRRRNAKAIRRDEPNILELKLTYRPPFDWDGLLAFFRMRAIPGVECVADGRYRRVVRYGDAVGVLDVRHDAEARAIAVSIPAHLARHAAHIAERVRGIFDLRADPEPVAAVLRRDDVLEPLVAQNPGQRLPSCWDGFELAVRAVLGQQVSVAAATTLSGRIVSVYGTPLDNGHGNGTITHAFPASERLAEASFDGIGLTKKRAETVRGLAVAVADGRVCFGTPASLDEAVAALVELPGIGPWTAQYIAMRALGEPDGFPSGDLGLRKALSNGNGLIAEKALLARAEAWRPWRGYAAIHLWNSLASGG